VGNREVVNKAPNIRARLAHEVGVACHSEEPKVLEDPALQG